MKLTIQTSNEGAVIDETPEAITGLFKQLRQRSGLTLSALAQLMGYRGASSIQRFENPSTFKGGYPTDDFIQRLEKAIVGRGHPPIKDSEVYQIGGPRYAVLRAGAVGSTSDTWPCISHVRPGANGILVPEGSWRIPESVSGLFPRSAVTRDAIVSLADGEQRVLFIDRASTLMDTPGEYAVSDVSCPCGIRIDVVEESTQLLKERIFRTDVLGKVVAKIAFG